MSNPLISTVIPTYNYGHYVTSAVDSALSQTFTDQEVIVVDDGSQDDTRERLSPYLDRIRYIYQENCGLSAARNTGINAARGEWIALLDADDVWHPRKLELQVACAREWPEAGLVAAAHVEAKNGSWPLIEIDPSRATRLVSYSELVIRSRFGPSGAVIRRSCLEQVGPFDVDLRSAEDRDMWLRIARNHPIMLLTQPLWWYRMHGNNMSKSAVRMEENELRVLRNAFAREELGSRSLRLRMKAFSFAAYSASVRYDEAEVRLKAFARMLQSFLLWPLPYRLNDVRARLARPKKLAIIIMRGSRSMLP